jgi:hypothetical protein
LSNSLFPQSRMGVPIEIEMNQCGHKTVEAASVALREA